MKILQLQYFVEVVKTNNISKAAKNLYVSQPAISSAIRELEKEFNTTLFIRYNNQITLTDEGHYLYHLSLDLIKNFEKARNDMFSYLQKAEILKLGVPPMIGTFVLPPIIAQYTKLHPNIEIQLLELGSVINKKALLDREINLGLFVKDANEELIEALEYYKIFETTLLFTVNKNHPLAKKEIISIEDLRGYPLILMKEDCLQACLIQKEFEKNDITPNIKVKTNQFYTIKELIKNNNLGAFMFNQVVENDPSLVGIPLKNPINLEIIIASRKDSSSNALAKEFLNFIINCKKL